MTLKRHKAVTSLYNEGINKPATLSAAYSPNQHNYQQHIALSGDKQLLLTCMFMFILSLFQSACLLIIQGRFIVTHSMP